MGASSHLRKTCRLCEGLNIEKVVPLEPIPLPDKFLTKDQLGTVSEEFFPVDIYMCRDCGHVQILEMINPEILWDDDFSFHSGQSKGVIEHFDEVSQKVIQQYKPTSTSLVVDVGSNDGTMLNFFKKAGFRVLGIDPIKRIAQEATEAGIKTLPTILTPEVAQKIRNQEGPASVVMAFNVFAHAHDMGHMAESIRSLLAPDGIFVFEVQYLMDIIDRMLFGTIFHEHMSHHSMLSMQQFLKRHGMELIDIERNSMQGGSIIGVVQLTGGPRPVSTAVTELLKLEKERGLDKPQTMKEFGRRLNAMRKQVKELLTKWKGQGATVAGYGAARSGPTLIAQLDLGDAISYIVDDHPQKVNKFSPGHHIEVLPTSELYKRMPDYVVILAWIHAKKIIESNVKYLEDGGHFVVCIPDIQVVGAGQAAAL